MFAFRKKRQSPALSLTAPVAPTAHVSIAERDDRAILMDLRTGNYYALDDVGTRIWQLLPEMRTPAQILDVIEREYDAPAQQLRADALRFLTSLLALRLVRQ
jgi:hypothetical protein